MGFAGCAWVHLEMGRERPRELHEVAKFSLVDVAFLGLQGDFRRFLLSMLGISRETFMVIYDLK